MKRIYVFLILALIAVCGRGVAQVQYAPASTMQVDQAWSNASSDFDESELDVISTSEDSLPSGRFKQPLQFSREELNRIRDPRVRDIYWYALNDTVDKKQYLKVHYAFNRARDNWAFLLGGGVQSVYMFSMGSEFNLGPQFEFGFKKDLHPYWAARVMMQVSHMSNHYLTSPHESTFIANWADRVPPIPYEGWRQRVEYTTITGRFDVMLNLRNLFAGRELLYRHYENFIYAGSGGMYSAHDLGKRDGSCFVPFWAAGWLNTWTLGKSERFAFYVDATCSWQGDDLEGYSEQNSTLKFSAMCGLSYKFSDKIHFMRLGYDDSQNRPVVQETSDGDNISSYVVTHQGDTAINLPPDLIEAAFFQIDRVELAHAYVLNLGFYAKMINNYPNQKFLVRGFADKEVGSLKRNLWLCQKRAEVVYDVLTKSYGVNPDQLVMGGGDLDEELPFLRDNGHHRFNRCVIVAPLNREYQDVVNTTSFDDKAELMDGRVKSNIRKNY